MFPHFPRKKNVFLYSPISISFSLLSFGRKFLKFLFLCITFFRQQLCGTSMLLHHYCASTALLPHCFYAVCKSYGP